MPKIFLRGQRNPIIIPQNLAQKLSDDWKNNNLPKIIELGALTIKSDEIKWIDLEDEQKIEKPEFYWTDEELNRWEKEIFSDCEHFEPDYLVKTGAWIINAGYPNGAIRNPKLYNELIKKWAALQNLRYRREKANKYNQESLASIKEEEIDVGDIPF